MTEGSRPEIVIRRAESVDDYRACQAAQRRAWGIADDSYVVPVATMVGAQHHGGLVLGAFLPDGEAVAMSFAFLGRADGGRLCLYSQLTGVVPGYQSLGLGHQLKTRQREIARAEDVPCIAWAFDPLQAGNARFNLEKLGAVAVRYIEDMYGRRSDALNRDTPTDRLIVVWETEPGERPRYESDPQRLFEVAQVDGFPAPVEARSAGTSSATLLLPVPPDITRLRAERPDLAARWGEVVRHGFLDAFAAGYKAVGFDRAEGAYLLAHPAP